ncbi:MAG TPA: triple tyrosine motif-containing protein [Bacteroidota bacterium]|jgi:signal transduction histidine kinase|nr:triple tyrosine motif-containing protein [Bacteroidota bacterium]
MAIVEFIPRSGDSNSISSDIVCSILESSDGRLWIGTYNGLNLFNRETNSFTRFTTRSGLPNNFVLGILEDDSGFLWLSTNGGGLSRFDPKTKTFRNYDVNDGLQSNEFNQIAAFKSTDGEMFFGGVHGLTSFFPDSIKDNPHIPPIRLTSFKIFSQGREPTRIVRDYDSVSLEYPENTISVEFTALDYTMPIKNQYAYMLEGFDKEWVYCGTRRFATYTNIDPGDYVLRVKGSNNDGLWNEAGISIPLFVAPPFWKTLWFRGGLGLSIVLLMSGAFYSRIRSVKKKNIFLEQKVRERTQELSRTNESLSEEIETRKRVEEELVTYEHQLEDKVREQTGELSMTVDSLEREIVERKNAEEKLLEYQKQLQSLASQLSLSEEQERRRMATYLHDYIGHTLAMAKIKLGSINGNDLARIAEEVRSLIDETINNTRSLTFELSPPVLAGFSFGDAVEWLVEHFKEKHNLLISYEKGPLPKELPEDLRSFLYHTTRELLVNIVKHAKANSAEVLLRQRDGMIEIRVRDDGRGFDPASVDRKSRHITGFGLFNLQERVAHYNGEIEIRSGPGNGTIVAISVPLGEPGDD